MNTEPVITIGALVTSIKVAVVAVVGVLAIAADLDPELTAQLILAAGLVVIAIGDVIAWYLQRQRVTPIASPTLPIGTVVNHREPGLPDAVVVEK